VTDDYLTIMSSTVHDALTVSMKGNKKGAEIMNDDSQWQRPQTTVLNNGVNGCSIPYNYQL